MNLPALGRENSLYIQQRLEIPELFGIESRNKYQIQSGDGQVIGFAAEQQKGILGFLLRQIVGHWRTFSLNIYNHEKQVIIVAHHPFRFYFQRLEIRINSGERYWGAIQRRFSFFHTCFDIEDQNRSILFKVKRPLWRFWKFTVFQDEKIVGLIEKKWTGLLAEAFTDKDNFKVSFSDTHLDEQQRWLISLAGIFIDLTYFENKQGKNSL